MEFHFLYQPLKLAHGVNYLVVLIGVTIAGAKAGIVGVFLTTPVIATLRELLDYVYRKVSEAPEIELSEENKPSLIDQVRSIMERIRLPFRRYTQVEEDKT